MDKEKTDIYDRDFGFCRASWKIYNFCFETSRENFPISTPEFSVDGQYMSKWKMVLNPRAKNGEDEIFLLILERTGSDTAPEIACVSFKLSTFDKKGKQIACTRYKSKFLKSDRHELPLWNVNFVQEKMKAKNIKIVTLTFRFELMVYFDGFYRDIMKPNDIGISTLSQNMMNLYKSGRLHDVSLRVDEKLICAHKVVLSSRSDVLAKLIDENKPEVDISHLGNESVIDLSDLDHEAMEHIVKYFYSGDMNHIAKYPSIEMTECAIYLNLPFLKYFFSPQGLEIESTIDVRNHTYIWAIRNFSDLSKKSISSPLLASEYIDAVFKISFHTEGLDENSEHVAIFAELVEGTIPKNACFEFSILQQDMPLCCEKRLFPNEIDGKFGLEKFIEKEIFKLILGKISGDTLIIALTLEIHNDVFSSTESYKINKLQFFAQKQYEMLSLYLSKMYKNETLADIMFEVEGQSFKAHKCILSARAPGLYSMLKEAKDEKLIVSNIKSTVFEKVIRYIYSGLYQKVTIDDTFFQVYKAAREYEIPCLKQKSLNILKEGFNAKSVCDALLRSDEFDDFELKLCAVGFIRQNRERFFEDTNWKCLGLNKPQLCSEIEALFKEKNKLAGVESV